MANYIVCLMFMSFLITNGLCSFIEVSSSLHSENIAIEVVDHHTRIQRSPQNHFSPQLYRIVVPIKRKQVAFILEHVPQHNIITYVSKNGVVVPEATRDIGAVYRGVNKDATLVVGQASQPASDNGIEIFEGIISHDNTHYVIKPDTNNLTHTHVLHEIQRDVRVIPKLRRKRQTSTNYVCELFVVFDYAVYEQWYNSASVSAIIDKNLRKKRTIDLIKQYYIFAVTAIDNLYASVRSQGLNLRVVPTALYIADTKNASPFTSSIVTITASGRAQINPEEAEAKFITWANNNNYLPRYDHAMLLTGYNKKEYQKDDGLPSGVANYATVCTDESASVSIFHTDFDGIRVAAHELAHSLGTEHDGDPEDGNKCDPRKTYIMTIGGTPYDDIGNNPWLFSKCSVANIQANIDKLNRDDNNCLLKRITTTDSVKAAFTTYGGIKLGQKYTLDQQCALFVGNRSIRCADDDDADLCQEMMCSLNGNAKTCVYVEPFAYTPCGDPDVKVGWCYQGQCVDTKTGSVITTTTDSQDTSD